MSWLSSRRAPAAAKPPSLADVAGSGTGYLLMPSFFGAAARLTRSDRNRRSWSALRDLEIQTNAGVAAFIARSELALKPTNTLARAAGTTGGAGLQLLPYGLQLRAVRLPADRYLPAFHRLARYYEGTEEAAFFDYVVQHELAIIEFTGNALTDTRGALDPVLRLLDRGVPGLTSTHPSQAREYR